MSKAQKISTRIASFIAAAILLQTLFFKFTAHPDSVYIFSQLGLEPFGRVGLGVVELITAILLIIPRTTLYGNILSVAVISGAIFSHLLILGVEVQNDGGSLFFLAVAVFVASAFTLVVRRDEIFQLIFRSRKQLA